MEKIENKRRVFEISLLNVFFCMLVIFIHVSSNPISALEKDSWQYLVVMIPWRLSAFVVQGFIFLSGLKLFLNKSNGIVYAKFYINRLYSIVLPYIGWVFVYYIYFCSNNYFPFKISDLMNYILIGNLVSHFYFVIIIIQFYVLTPFWMRLVKNTNVIILIPLSLMATIILGQDFSNIIGVFFNGFTFRYSDRVFTTYLVYWIAGCFAGLYYDKFKEILCNNRKIITVTFIILAACNAFLSYLSLSGRQNIYWLENIHMTYCLIAILFFYMLSCYGNRKALPMVKKYVEIDRMTYVIYLAHCLVIFKVNDFLSLFNITSIGLSYLIRICTVYPITIFGAALYYKIKKLLLRRP